MRNRKTHSSACIARLQGGGHRSKFKQSDQWPAPASAPTGEGLRAWTFWGFHAFEITQIQRHEGGWSDVSNAIEHICAPTKNNTPGALVRTKGFPSKRCPLLAGQPLPQIAMWYSRRSAEGTARCALCSLHASDLQDGRRRLVGFAAGSDHFLIFPFTPVSIFTAAKSLECLAASKEGMPRYCYMRPPMRRKAARLCNICFTTSC
jgi:hypothetical protein